MDKLEKLVSDFLSTKFNEWKPYLSDDEQKVFGAYYFKGMSTLQISFEMNYSQRNIQKILRKAKRKIYKILP
ncbi:MAG: hypothetical protein K2O94_07825 [Clostridiales bacterium]|nr:hypothetical protein [Clostridiales bacterium]